MMTTIAEKTIAAIHGFLEQIVSDNGAQFTSDCFSSFLKKMELNMSIQHRTIHPPMVGSKIHADI